MKRYNFDEVPAMASGFSVHAETMQSAIGQAKTLAKKLGYFGKLVFRDNEKCIKSHYDRCKYCYPIKRRRLLFDFWISSLWATGWVQVDDEGIIIDTAPVWKKFRGQCIEALTTWLKKKSEVKVVKI
jgi:hypothetical protein